MNNCTDICWESAALTHVGKVRSINEDSLADFPETGLWAVADGMGGHDAGDFASQAIVKSLGNVRNQEQLSDYVEAVEEQLLTVNHALIEEAAGRKNTQMIGSTVVALLALKHHCACLWVGDSRAYRLRDGSMRSVTRDHSQVEEMIQEGVLLREDAESHPAANVITRAVGAEKALYIDVELEEIFDGDRYLLCSDGLYKEISEQEIAEQLMQGNCQEVCDRLLDIALQRGVNDNVTIIVIEFKKV
ncbi:MAG: protein phosphatase 2C domain-containing protein [Gammaproteobacteria bacterium]